MAIARTVQNHLREKRIKYRTLSHPRTGSSMESAEQAHVPGGALAKGVIALNGQEYLMLVIPSDYHVDFEALGRHLGVALEMASEEQIDAQFPDCARGAIPPLGYLYGMKTLWDPSTTLGQDEKVYFEAGDHEHLIQISGEQFHELMSAAERKQFGKHL